MEPRILVVDDQETNVDLLSRRLRRAGYEVSSAGNGRDALAMLEQQTFDLVLLDQMMPGMNGLDVLREIRLHGPGARVPIIMVTAVSDSAAVVEALHSGANDYITKPVDFQVALARIQSHLARGVEQAAAQKREERYALAMRGNGSGIWDWDLQTGSIDCSASLCALMKERVVERQFSPDEIAARVWPRDRVVLRKALAGRRGGRTPDVLSVEFRLRDAEGNYPWMHLDGVTIHDQAGNAIRRVGSLVDVTAKKTTDALSGLLNRAGLSEQIGIKLRTQPEEGTSTLLLLQIHAFAELSLSISAATIEGLVRQVAERTRATIDAVIPAGKRAVLARLKDDTLAVFIEHAPGDWLPETLVKHLHAMAQPLPAGKRSVFVSLHSGIAVLSEEVKTASALIRDASAALEVARMNNDGRLVCFDRSMLETQNRRRKLEHDLYLALEKREFEVLYQPRVELVSGRICGFEALVRWHHGRLGMISPVEFIPIAESTGLICELGGWVLEEACRQTSTWIRQFGLGEEFEIAVNLSIRQCHQSNLIEQIVRACTGALLPAKHLKLEITESLFAGDVDHAREMLTNLKGLGVGLKLDDFGTGYSCFQYLCDLPFDSLKIDRSFVRRLEGNSKQAADVIRTVVSIGQSLGLEVIAEGIETPEQAKILTEMGCPYGQGYLFSKPVSADVAEDMLARQSNAAAA